MPIKIVFRKQKKEVKIPDKRRHVRLSSGVIDKSPVSQKVLPSALQCIVLRLPFTATRQSTGQKMRFKWYYVHLRFVQ